MHIRALRSKELPVDLRNRFVSSHTSGEEFIKKFCCIEGSQKHVVSVTLDGRCLKQPGLFIELASWPNWPIDGERLWLVWWPRTWWSLCLSSMIICGDRRNLQKDKHHCNTPSIWALWQCGKAQSSLQCRHMETHLEFAKKHLKYPQTVRNKILWSEEPQFQTSCLKETSSAHHLQSTIPKVKCAGSSLMLWSCFSAAGTEGLIRVEEKLNAPKYWDSLNANPVQSIPNLRLGRRFTFQQDNGPKHTARVAYRQVCECPWVAQPQPGIKPSQIFLEKPENVHLPPSNLKELERWRGEEKNSR